jgi:hypothetical protein
MSTMMEIISWTSSVEVVRDKINPRDTWIQKHLGVTSRTFVPPSKEKIV